MKPQDIIVMLKILLWPNEDWTIAKIAVSIGLSPSETHSALKRCELADLYSPVTRKPIVKNLEEFIIYGLRYVFPAEEGPRDRGIPTAHSALPLSNLIVDNNNEQYVWPDANGKERGVTVSPLYPSVSEAVSNDKKLYKMLALIDALRLGKTRERKMAQNELQKVFEKYI